MFFQQLVNGLTLGSAYAVIAIGYTLVFGVLNIVNMAHGGIFMIGAYIGLLLVTEAGMNIFPALAGAMIGVPWSGARFWGAGWSCWRSVRFVSIRRRIWRRSSVRSAYPHFLKVWRLWSGGRRPVRSRLRSAMN